jgi:hypothetical protein
MVFDFFFFLEEIFRFCLVVRKRREIKAIESYFVKSEKNNIYIYIFNCVEENIIFLIMMSLININIVF